MSDAVIEIMKDIFKKLDTDGNGSLSIEEVVAGLKEAGLPDSEIQSAKATMDKKDAEGKGDGKITLEEFIAWWSA